MSFRAMFDVANESLHAIKTSFVQRLENVQRSKKEGTGAARRIKHRHTLDRVPECSEQLRSFAILDHILRELTDVDVKRDEFIDVMDSVGGEFLSDLIA